MVSSAIVDKYIGESARLIREMFGYARDHEPCIIFMDEIDAIGPLFFVSTDDITTCCISLYYRYVVLGGRRFSEGTSADREIQRTLMEVGDIQTSRQKISH